MQRFQREPFDEKAQFECLKPFVMSGKTYRMGDVVDTAAVESRRLRQMYESRMISPVRPAQAALLRPPAPAPAPAPRFEAPRPVPVNGPRIEHRGFGRWYFTDAAGNEHGPFSKAQAEDMLPAGG